MPSTEASVADLVPVPAVATPPRLLRLARATAFAIALPLMGVVLFGIYLQYHALQTPCPESVRFCVGLTAGNLRGVASPERALVFFSAFRTVQDLLVRVVFWTVALLLIWQRPTYPVALLAAFIFLAFGNTGGLQVVAAAVPQLAAVVILALLLTYGGMALLFCLFPNGRFVPGWSRWLALAWWVLLLSNLILPAPPFERLPPWFPGLVLLLFLTFQIYRYWRVATQRERRQMRWAIFGFAVFLGGFATISLLGWSFPRDRPLTSLDYLIGASHSLLACAVPVTIGVAVLRDNLFDIDLVINRTLVYGVLTALIVGVYLLVVSGLGAVLGDGPSSLGQGQTAPLQLLAAAVVAAVFQPLRYRLQQGVNSLMYGQRDEPYAVLARLGLQLETAIEPAAALPLTVETVARALKLPYVAILLKQAGALQTAAAYGVTPVNLERFPLVYAGDNIGELVVATRAPAEPLAPADRRLLADLARQIGVTAHARLLAANLERARLQIVAAHEETRRRLGSDLHDGVGHQLAGLVRRVELATNLVEHDATKARSLLAEITGQLNAAMDQVRGLAHQLHPPELEVLGLAGALRERAQTHTGFALQIDAPDALPSLPTAIETAAYYIALAALANVEKHANAHACTVRLALTRGHNGEPAGLELDVTDDGRGLPAQTDRAGGLGLLSMQARASEVGGHCRFVAESGGGTRVIVRLPFSVTVE